MNESFYQKVYKIVSQIPRGKVLTYKEVAELAGSPGAYRAVGSAMRNNPDKSTIPCHRVVGSDGGMHGYAFGGESIKIEMLKDEGVKFKGDRVNFELKQKI